MANLPQTNRNSKSYKICYVKSPLGPRLGLRFSTAGATMILFDALDDVFTAQKPAVKILN